MFLKRFGTRLLLCFVTLLLVTVACSSQTEVSQETVVDLNRLADDDYNFAAAEYAVEFAAGETDNPFARDYWFWYQRAYPFDEIPAEVHRAAINTEAANISRFSRAGTWSELGPKPLNAVSLSEKSQDASGRALTVAPHPTNASVVLVGTAQGGIWRSADGGATFAPVGDNLPSLAIKVITFAKSDPNIVYAGSGEPHASTSIYGQGVFKSTNAGATWSALPISGAGWDFTNMSVAGVKVNPTNPNIVHVATASVATVTDQFKPSSTPEDNGGLFKSTDGGQTWVKQLGIHLSTGATFGFIDLDMSQTNGNLLYATELKHGIWKTTNGGTNWSLITPVENIIYGRFPATVNNYGKYNTTTGQFDTLPHVAVTGDTVQFNRIDISLAQSNTNVLYAGYEAANFKVTVNGVEESLDGGVLFKTIDGGVNWTYLGSWNDGVPNYCGAQCGYDNTLEVNPTNANDLIIGGNANYDQRVQSPLKNPTRISYKDAWSGMVYRSLNGGVTWVDTTPHCGEYDVTNNGSNSNDLPIFDCIAWRQDGVIHPDIQAGAYDPHNANRFYVVNDGGVMRATVSNGGTNEADYSWANLNTSASFSTLQFYEFDIHPTDTGKAIGGLQDNSVGYYDASALNKWDAWLSGDGLLGAFDPLDPQYIYGSSQNSISRHDSGGSKDSSTWKTIWTPVTFLVVLDTSKATAGKIVTANKSDDANGLFVSTDRGDNWNRLMDMGSSATTVSASPINGNLVFAGTYNTDLIVHDGTNGYTHAAGTGAPDSLPDRFITQVEASPVDQNIVYVTYSGYGTGHVFKVTKTGATWATVTVNDISGDLPNIPVTSIQIDPNNAQRMWVGTDVGVFKTLSANSRAATWFSVRGDMPIVAIMDLRFDSTNDLLWAATHGRGVWRLPEATTTAVTLNTVGTQLQPQLVVGLALGALSLLSLALWTQRKQQPRKIEND